MKQFRNSIFTSSLLLLILFLIPLSNLNSREQQTYLIGVEEINYSPYYSVKDGNWSGYIRDIFDLFEQKSGLKFNYLALPIKRLHDGYLNKEIDLLYPDNPDWIIELKKNRTITYSKPIVTVIDGIIVKKENHKNTLEQTNIIGTISGYTAPAWNNIIAEKKIEWIEVESFEGLLKMVIHGRIDGAYVSINPALYQLREYLHQTNVLTFNQKLPYDVAQHMLSTINHPGVIDEFNSFLSSNRSELSRIAKKYKIKKIIP